MNHLAAIATQRTGIAARLDPLVAAGSRCALLDFPAYANVGDSAIWLGARAYLRSRRARVTYTCDASTLRDDVVRASRPDTILLTGGGNFGDLYPRHQAFREHVIERFPDRRIIQLPQTLQFREPANLERAQRTLNRHRDLVLLWRDRRSLALAQEAFDATNLLVPDMAMFLGPLTPPHDPSSDVVWLARADFETAAERQPIAGREAVDWVSNEAHGRWSRLGLTDLTRRRLARRVRGAGPTQPWSKALSATFEALAAARLRSGCSLLSAGRTVVTDRLHAHLLSVLLGIPHFVYGDGYGKVQGYHETWLKGIDTVRWAGSAHEALRLSDDWLRSRAA